MLATQRANRCRSAGSSLSASVDRAVSVDEAGDGDGTEAHPASAATASVAQATLAR